MADYNPNQFVTPQESRILTLEAELRQVRQELTEYKRRDIAEQMKNLDYGPSPIKYYVECNICFAAVKEEKMAGHRERCK